MIIRYIYVNKYNDFMNNININLGGEKEFDFFNSTLNIINKNHIYANVFRNINCINDITAIVGKNSSGKTTVLKAINSIFVEAFIDFEFVCVFELGNSLYYYSNYLSEKDISIDKISFTDIDIKYINRVDFYKTLRGITIMYTSSIFDKSTTLFSHDRLIDISTNNLLRDFIQTRQTRQKKQRKIQSEEIDFIDEFKKSEISKKMDYFIKLEELKNNSNIEFSEIFDFPETLEIEFTDNYEEMNMLLEDIRGINDNLDLIMTYLSNRINNLDYLPEKLDEYSKEVAIRNEFSLLILFEVFAKVSEKYKKEIEDVALDFKNLIETNDTEIDIFCNLNIILDRILKRDKKFIIDSDDEERKEYKVYTKYTSYLDKYSNIEFLVNEEIENLEDYSFQPEYIINIINQFKQMQEIIYPDLLEIAANSSIIQDCLNINEEIIEYENTYIAEDLSELLNFNDEDELFSKTLELLENIKINIASIISLLNDEINKSQVEIRNLTYEIESYVEDDNELIQYINTVKEMLASFEKLIDTSEIIIKENGDYATINTKWTSNEFKKFINLYNELEFNIVLFTYLHEDISSGHIAYLDIFSRIAVEISNLNKEDNEILLLIDEADIFLHPEVQIKYFDNLLSLLQLFCNERKVQIVITSNSPFIISDLPHTNILYLNELKIKPSTEINRTFGANIHELLIHSFFMKNGVVGDFAKKQINYIIDSIKDRKEQDKEYIYKLIQLIGEPLIRNKLMFMYDRTFTNTRTDIDRELEECKKRIEYLHSIKRNDE